jgi:epoxyqueuosine reductase QueG
MQTKANTRAATYDEEHEAVYKPLTGQFVCPAHCKERSDHVSESEVREQAATIIMILHDIEQDQFDAYATTKGRDSEQLTPMQKPPRMRDEMRGKKQRGKKRG